VVNEPRVSEEEDSVKAVPDASGVMVLFDAQDVRSPAVRSPAADYNKNDFLFIEHLLSKFQMDFCYVTGT